MQPWGLWVFGHMDGDELRSLSPMNRSQRLVKWSEKISPVCLGLEQSWMRLSGRSFQVPGVKILVKLWQFRVKIRPSLYHVIPKNSPGMGSSETIHPLYAFLLMVEHSIGEGLGHIDCWLRLGKRSLLLCLRPRRRHVVGLHVQSFGQMREFGLFKRQLDWTFPRLSFIGYRQQAIGDGYVWLNDNQYAKNRRICHLTLS